MIPTLPDLLNQVARTRHRVNSGSTLYARRGINWPSTVTLTESSTTDEVSVALTFGYVTGSGGTVTQATSKSTTVVLSKSSGQITMNAAALAASTTVSFTLTNTLIAATDLLVLNHVSGGTAGAYTLNAQCASGSASINVRNVSLGSLSEAIVIGFAVVKAVTA